MIYARKRSRSILTTPELAQGERGGTSYLPALGGKRPGGMSGGNMSRGNVWLPLQQTINVTQVKQAAQSITVLLRRQLRADNGSWVRVMGQMGEQIWLGHVGHGSVPVTRWPILHCTHPASHVIFWLTISVTAWPETSRQLRKRTDFLGKAQILLRF